MRLVFATILAAFALVACGSDPAPPPTAISTIGVGPVGVAVITSYLAISTVRFFKEQQQAM